MQKHNISIICHYDSLSLCKVAKLLGVSRAAVSHWCDSGQLPIQKVNKTRLMVTFKDVKKFLQSRDFKVKLNEDGLNFFLGK